MIRGENGEYEEKREIFRIVVFSMNEENFFQFEYEYKKAIEEQRSKIERIKEENKILTEKEFEYIVICGGSSLDKLDNCLPCGYCRQFMSEFVDENFKIYALSENDKLTEYTIGDLLPHSFKL